MKTILFTICLTVSTVVSAQDYKAEFGKSFPKDTLRQREILEAWEKANPEDAELYTCYYNYYFFKAREEVITLTQDEPQSDTFILKDSLDNTAGYIGEQIIYNEDLFEKAMRVIDKGIELFPDRLDMRFGKIYGLQQKKDWQAVTDEVIKAIRYSKSNKNKWTWTDNKKFSGGTDGFLSSIQDYQYQLYNTGDDKLLVNMRTIAEEILNIYPNNVESLSNISITYLLTGEYDKGIDALKRAEKINPKDCIVLNNIAHGYKLKGDKANAIEYYKKIIEYGDEQEINAAKQAMKDLEK